ncbi:MAG: glycosyltransferase, partial [Acidobacteriota bacterium]
YILDPFLVAGDNGDDLPYSHTHFWESWTLARTLVDLGYRVDVVSWTNQAFVPTEPYDLVIDVRSSLERWDGVLPPETLRVLHIDTGHHTFHNPAQVARLEALARRRRVQVRPQKMLPKNLAMETAHCATVLGNRFTQGTYAFARKPLLHIPISVPFTYPWPDGKDFEAARRRFLWFGSGGLVHKGLDLVLEAFAGMPEMHLTVCGPIRAERDFERVYFQELYRTPNIRTHGWIDVDSEAFRRLGRETLGLVYPSCSEGGGSSVLTCMHGSIVPMVTFETSVDIDPSYGVLLRDARIETLRDGVRALAERPATELEGMARAGWEHARRHHTKETFAAGARDVMERLVDGRWRDVPPPQSLDEVWPGGVPDPEAR